MGTIESLFSANRGKLTDAMGRLMSFRQIWQRFKILARTELNHLFAINDSDRRWQMPLCAALASGLPLFFGAWFGRLDFGLVASLGGLVFLYLPNTTFSHRMVHLMACAFGMIACHALGLLAHFLPLLLVPVLSGIAMLVTMLCRHYRVGPPGSLFFVMAAAIGAFTPVDMWQVPLHVGLLAMGAVLASFIAFLYSLYILRLEAPRPAMAPPAGHFDSVVLDAVVIGLFVGISLALAQLLQLERAYWVPISCIAVIQGASLRAVWNKQLQRILGTVIGLFLGWGLLMLPLDDWRMALLMTCLAFVIESLIVRHYGMAVVFITPLTLFLAEATHLATGISNAIFWARLFDTVLGSMVGLAGALCLHSPRFRRMLEALLRRLALGWLVR